MEQQLTNEEIARAFAMYLGQDMRGDIPYKISLPYWSASKGHKLLLTPLSAITDEHAIEVAKIGSNGKRKDAGEGRFYLAHHSLGKSKLKWWDIFQYLIQQGYAVALFFGINHPCNGNTAIELNIAIDKTLSNDTSI